MSRYAEHTLLSLVVSILQTEKDALAARAERDRLLGRARGAALEMSDHISKAADLRQILASIDEDFYREHLGEPVAPDADPDRQQLLDGWRDVIAFLESTPQLPFTTRYAGLDIEAARRSGSDQQRREEIARIAGLLGTDEEIDTYRNYRGKAEIGASRQFGSVLLHATVELDGEPEAQPTGGA